MHSHEIPEFIFSDIFVMVKLDEWRAIESCHSVGHPTTNDVLVVPMILGKGFFHKRSPKSLIVTNVTEDSRISTIPCVFLEWKIVINDLGVRNTQGIEMERINALIIDLCVLYDSFESVWVLSKSCGGGQVPTISNSTLSNITWADSLSPPKGVGIIENFAQSCPINLFSG